MSSIWSVRAHAQPVIGQIDQGIGSGQLIELAPARSLTGVATLAAIPSFVIGWAQPPASHADKFYTTGFIFGELFEDEVIQVEPQRKSITFDDDLRQRSVWMGVPSGVLLRKDRHWFPFRF